MAELIKTYSDEIRNSVKRFYWKAFRRKLPQSLKSIEIFPEKQYEETCRKIGHKPSKRERAIVDEESFHAGGFNMILKEDTGERIIPAIGHELFHIYLYDEMKAGRVRWRRSEEFVIDEAFAHLGYRFFYDQLRKDEQLSKKYPVGDFISLTPLTSIHKKAYKLTDRLVKKFSPHYFKPVKRLLLHSQIEELLDYSDLELEDIIMPKR